VEALAGPFLASAGLLVVAGAGKLRDPLPLARALRLAGLPVGVPAVRAGAACRGPARPGRGADRRRPRRRRGRPVLRPVHRVRAARPASWRALSSCGCFGTADTPPTWTHVAVTGALALAATAVAVRPLGPLPELLAGAPGTGLPLLVATAAVAVTAYVVLAVLPLLAAARTPAR
jgi:hypothetical protein